MPRAIDPDPPYERAMVVVAHADDAEYGCSGSVAKMIREGIEVVYVLCTDGSKGSDDPKETQKSLIRTRQQEQIAAGKVLGLTATPIRLNTDGFGGSMLKFLTRTRPKIFKELIHVTQVGELYENGYLSKLKYDSVEAIDTKRLRLNSTGADFTDSSVRDHYLEIDFKERLVEVVENVLETRKNVLVFTRFVEEARYIASMFKSIEIVTAETKKKDREDLIAAFRNNEINIANVGVLTRGFDFPELETVVIGKPTRSLTLW
ncbi:MAG: PIG-L family deacetylase [Chloroflexi bacterium]|nr:PIG-L family deacetylase [Chloroflexota bacterium]